MAPAGTFLYGIFNVHESKLCAKFKYFKCRSKVMVKVA